MPDLYSQENSDQCSQPRGPTGGKKTRAGPGAVRGYLVKAKGIRKTCQPYLVSMHSLWFVNYYTRMKMMQDVNNRQKWEGGYMHTWCHLINFPGNCSEKKVHF